MIHIRYKKSCAKVKNTTHVSYTYIYIVPLFARTSLVVVLVVNCYLVLVLDFWFLMFAWVELGWASIQAPPGGQTVQLGQFRASRPLLAIRMGVRLCENPTSKHVGTIGVRTCYCCYKWGIALRSRPSGGRTVRPRRAFQVRKHCFLCFLYSKRWMTYAYPKRHDTTRHAGLDTLKYVCT